MGSVVAGSIVLDVKGAAALLRICKHKTCITAFDRVHMGSVFVGSIRLEDNLHGLSKARLG